MENTYIYARTFAYEWCSQTLLPMRFIAFSTGYKFGVVKSYDQASTIYEGSGIARNFIKPDDELIQLKDQTIDVYNQWGIDRGLYYRI